MLKALIEFVPLVLAVVLLLAEALGDFFGRTSRCAESVRLERHLRLCLMQRFGVPYGDDVEPAARRPAFGGFDGVRSAHVPVAGALGPIRSHRLLRLRQQLQTQGRRDSSQPYQSLFTAEALLVDERDRFWLVRLEAQRRAAPRRLIAAPSGKTAHHDARANGRSSRPTDAEGPWLPAEIDGDGYEQPAWTLLGEPLILEISELRARRALFNDPAAYEHAFGEAPSRASLAAWRRRHPEQQEAE